MFNPPTLLYSLCLFQSPFPPLPILQKPRWSHPSTSKSKWSATGCETLVAAATHLQGTYSTYEVFSRRQVQRFMHEISQGAHVLIRRGMLLTEAEFAARSGFSLDFLLSEFSTLWIFLLSELHIFANWASKSPYLSLMLWRCAITYTTVPRWTSIETNSYAVLV